MKFQTVSYVYTIISQTRYIFFDKLYISHHTFLPGYSLYSYSFPLLLLINFFYLLFLFSSVSCLVLSFFSSSFSFYLRSTSSCRSLFNFVLFIIIILILFFLIAFVTNFLLLLSHRYSSRLSVFICLKSISSFSSYFLFYFSP